MSDPMVLKAQQWANEAFAEVAGYTPCTEDGETGQETLNSLIEGLQYLIGISPSVANFGPTTYSTLVAYGIITATNSNPEITILLQSALYCKGYDGDALSGTWSDGRTTAGIEQLQEDLGYSSTAATGTVNAKLFKFLLNTNPAVLISGGADGVRSAQQWLNVTYTDRENFFYGSTGGVFDRPTQINLVYGIQYELGQSDADADGQFGPGTEGQLEADSSSVVEVGSTDTDAHWVHLFNAAVNFNGYEIPFSGTFTASDSEVVVQFQAFEGFTASEQTGIGDFTTWCELLVSTGNPNRAGTGADMASTITSDSAAALVAAGYQTVGRYLTNEQVSDPLDKNIKPGELDTIFDAELALFPIFEEGGYELSWFTAAQGVADAERAFTAAQGYGIPGGTTIYFAVDVDVIEAEVQADVIPYFEALNTQMVILGGTYGIGIYGSRNTCTLVREAGLSRSSFVAGLSTGYSGNLGFPLPEDWAFNQIDSLTVGSGDSAIDIDKDIVSGRDTGITSVNTPGNPRAAFFSWVDALQAYANQWVATGNATTTADRLVLQYMRYPNYGSGGYDGNGTEWSIVAGSLDEGFISYVNANALPRVTSFVEPSFHAIAMDPEHLAAAADAILQNPVDSAGDLSLGDGGGWAGDLLQVTAQWQHEYSDQDIGIWMLQYIADTNPSDGSTFPVGDFFQDVDGYLLGSIIALSPAGTTANQIIRSFYATDGGWTTRFPDMFTMRYSGSDTGFSSIVDAVFIQTDATWIAFRDALLIDLHGDPFTLSANDIEAIAAAYVETFDTYRNG